MADSIHLAEVVAIWSFVLGLIALMGIVIYQLAKRDLTTLILEPVGGKASLSRFQMLIFTFVVAGLFVALSIDTASFVDVPASVLMLIGISTSGYVISKSISKDTRGVDDHTGSLKPEDPPENERREG